MLLFVCFLSLFLFLQNGWTALHFAARKGFEDIVKILVEHGSNIQLEDQVFIFFFDIKFLINFLIVGFCGSFF